MKVSVKYLCSMVLRAYKEYGTHLREMPRIGRSPKRYRARGTEHGN